MHPLRYSTISSCFTTLLKEQGPSALWRGWASKFFGSGVQGGFRFGLYEYFKTLYSHILLDHNRSFIFFLSSSSAEVFANLALCPFEAIKVRVQAQPHFAKGLLDGFPKLYASEGLHGFVFYFLFFPKVLGLRLWSWSWWWWIFLLYLYAADFTEGLYRFGVETFHVILWFPKALFSYFP